MAKKPSPERTFDQPLQVRVTTEQLGRFQQAAEADGRSLSSWVRFTLERAADKALKASKTGG